jgi:hypothetical protein
MYRVQNPNNSEKDGTRKMQNKINSAQLNPSRLTQCDVRYQCGQIDSAVNCVTSIPKLTVLSIFPFIFGTS